MSELFVHNPYPSKAFAPREKNDFYPTPLGCAIASVEWLRDVYGLNPRTVLDPGSGTGVWGKAVKKVYPDSILTGIELDPKFENPGDYLVWRNMNFLDYIGPDLVTAESKAHYDLIIGNPPYKLADEFISKSLSLVRQNDASRCWVIAFLLKLSYLGSQYRGKDLFVNNPPLDVVVYSRRPSFSGNGKTDGSEYGFFVWSNYPDWARWYLEISPDTTTTLSWLDWDYTEEDRRK